MKLCELLKGVQLKSKNIDINIDIENICYNSRNVKQGDMFIAICGYETDGHKYIKNALESGAVAIICEKVDDQNIPYILVENTRKALAQIASNKFENPSKKLKMIGVTGTNGKTTTTYLIKHILEKSGKKVGLIGTNQNMIGDEIIETERTTPESYELQELFKNMVDKDCTHCVMEVSSHSLVLDRVYNINFEVGVFTNLTQDHLDFHKTMEEYRKAKTKLFEISKTGVINIDDKASKQIIKDINCDFITYSSEENKNADAFAYDIDLKSNGISFNLKKSGKDVNIKLAIPGQFSVSNSMAAVCACNAMGISLEDCSHALKTACGVKGRVEVVKTNTDYTVIIDYAHSPDGVENILRAVRGFTKGKLISLFGCGGDRDRTKRPKMGAIASDLSDYCIVTSDNPRTENPMVIISDIIEGMKDKKTPYKVIEDRKEAIFYALDNAQKDDVIVLMGKGHETYQEINHIKHHMDEREIIEDYFKR